MLNFGDLFAGAGLFSCGFMSVGFRPVFAVELSEDAAASYARNVSDCIVASSVETPPLDVQKVDVLIAGPPCQGFSTLGRRDPLDVRNDLCLSVLPWIDVAEPSVVVIENVPPFIRSAHWNRLAEGLRTRGFDIAVWILDAVDFGTAQYRRRAFTIASKIGPINEPKPLKTRTTIRSVLLERPVGLSDPMHRWPIPSELARQRIEIIPPKGDKRDLMRAAPELCPPSWREIGCQATDVWGRMDADSPANTLRCTFQNPSKGRYLHPVEDRVISLREGARLQGVPDDWIFVGRPYPVARQIGNGVPVPLARAVASSILEAFERTQTCAASKRQLEKTAA